MYKEFNFFDPKTIRLRDDMNMYLKMSMEVRCLNSLVSHFFIEKMFFSVFASFKVNFI